MSTAGSGGYPGRADHVVCIGRCRRRVVAGFTVEQPRPGWPGWSAGCARPERPGPAIGRRDGPVVGALSRCRGDGGGDQPDQGRTCDRGTGRPAAKMTGSTRSCSLTRCAPPGPAAALEPTARPRSRCGRRPRPPRPGRPPGRGVQPAPRPPARVLPRRPSACSVISIPVSLAFLARFGCQDRADWLHPDGCPWLHSQGYSGRKDPAVLHASPDRRAARATGDDGAAQARITGRLLAVTARPGYPDQGPGRRDRRTARPCTPTATSSPRCPGPGPSAPPEIGDCSRPVPRPRQR